MPHGRCVVRSEKQIIFQTLPWGRRLDLFGRLLSCGERKVQPDIFLEYDACVQNVSVLYFVVGDLKIVPQHLLGLFFQPIPERRLGICFCLLVRDCDGFRGVFAVYRRCLDRGCFSYTEKVDGLFLNLCVKQFVRAVFSQE